MANREIVAEDVVSGLNSNERRHLFATLRGEVCAAYMQLSTESRRRWAPSARRLIEILDFFARDPCDQPGCSMGQAVELVCEFIAQTRRPIAHINVTLH